MKPLDANMIAILITIASLGICLIIAFSPLLRSLFIRRFGEENFSLSWNLFERFSGAVVLGGASFLCLSFFGESISLQNLFLLNRNVAIVSSTLLANMLLIATSVTASPKGRDGYPQIKLSHWNIRLALVNAGSWMVYLVSYEILLRGILLTACMNIFSMAGAVAINLLVYSAIHVPKSRKEVIGSIPFGLVLCLVTIATGSVLPAILLHISLPVSFDSACIFYYLKTSKQSMS